jgi:putative membrane protein
VSDTSPAAAPEDWRRTSPTGFVVRALMAMRNAALPTLAALAGSGAWKQGWLVIVPVFALACGISFAMAWLAWRHFRYRLGDTDIRVEKGLLSRTARSVPYERIQDVSVEQALLPRLFGMVQVKFETGAGGKDELKIGYIAEAEGAALRETVRARKSGETRDTAGEAGGVAEPEARPLFVMDMKRLLTFGLFEFSLVVFAVLGGALQQFDSLLQFKFWDFETWLHLLAGPGHTLSELGLATQVIGAVLALSVLGLLGLVTGIGRTVRRDYGFRLEETPKGLRRRRGLLTRTDVVMPLHRVQALKLTTGIVRRRFGWHGLSVVSLANDAKSESHVVVPFGTMEEIAPVVETTGFTLPVETTAWHTASRRQRTDSVVLTVLPFVLLTIAMAAIASRIDGLPAGGPMRAIGGLAAFGAFLTAREWHLWRHRRHAIDARQLFVREGWLAPHLAIASRVKLQSVEIAQGPLARRRGYANVKFGVAGGKLEMHGVPLDGARAIRAAVLDSIAAVDFSRLPDRV